MLKAINIHKIYDHSANKLHVLNGIDIEISQGECLSIVGPSGAGKSTLLHILGGLDQPSEGQVFLEDRDIYKLNDKDRAEMRNIRLGFIFQFYHLLPEFTALENVILPALVRNKFGMSEVKALGEKLLDRVGLQNRRHHKPSELSGGEQQRVAIARSLINKPSVIFCDEPTGNLDSENGKAIMALLLELNADNDQTIVIVTHDENIAEHSHRVVHMKDGFLRR